MSEKAQHLNDIVARTAGEALTRSLGGSDFLVTVEGAQVSPNRSSARIFVRVLPKEQEEAAAIAVRRALPAVQRYMNERLRMRHVPRVQFEVEHEGEGVGETKRLLDELGEKYGDDAI